MTSMYSTTFKEELHVSSSSAGEAQRWIRVLAVPFLGPCAFVAAALATGHAWLLTPAIVLGPGLGITALTYLALSSDVTSNAAEVIALAPEEESAQRAA
jgi:hypothetical protein